MTGSAPPRSHLSREVPAAAALLALGVGGRAVFAAVLLLVVEPRVNELVVARDEPPPHVSRFPLEVAGMTRSFARCAVESGEVTSLEWRRAWMRPGTAGSRARVTCELPAAPAGSSCRLRVEEAGRTGTEVVVSQREGVRIELPAPGGFSFRRDAGP